MVRAQISVCQTCFREEKSRSHRPQRDGVASLVSLWQQELILLMELIFLL